MKAGIAALVSVGQFVLTVNPIFTFYCLAAGTSLPAWEAEGAVRARCAPSGTRQNGFPCCAIPMGKAVLELGSLRAPGCRHCRFGLWFAVLRLRLSPAPTSRRGTGSTFHVGLSLLEVLLMDLSRCG